MILICTVFIGVVIGHKSMTVFEELKELCSHQSESILSFRGTLQKLFNATKKNKGIGGLGKVKILDYFPKGLTQKSVRSAVKFVKIAPGPSYNVKSKVIKDEIKTLNILREDKEIDFLKFNKCFISEDEDKILYIYIVLEALGDSMSVLHPDDNSTSLDNFKGHDYVDRLRLYLGLAKQIQRLHQLQIIHCDIKPQNFCFTNQKLTSAKLIDYSTSVKEGTRMYLSTKFFGDYEESIYAGSTVEDDIYSFGFSLALFELGKKRTLRNIDRNDNFLGITFDSFYWEKVNILRNLPRAADEKNLDLYPEGYSLLELLQGMMTVWRKDRIHSMDTVVAWLEMLVKFNSDNLYRKEFEEFKGTLDQRRE